MKKREIIMVSCMALLAFLTWGTRPASSATDDVSITFGPEYVFNGGDTVDISTTVLDSNHALIAYRDYGNSYYGTVVVATVSGSSITFSPERVFNAVNINRYYPISATTLDSGHALIAYRDHGNNGAGTAIVATVSGSSITFGPEYVFNSNWPSHISATALDSSHVLIAYGDGKGTAIVATVSGSSITFSPEHKFDANPYGISTTTLDPNHASIAYRDAENSGYGTMVVATVSGSSITFSPKNVFDPSGSSSPYPLASTALDSSNALIVYPDFDNSRDVPAVYGTPVHGTAVHTTVSGSSISYGSESVFNWDTTNEDLSATALDPVHVLIAYEDLGSGTVTVARLGAGDIHDELGHPFITTPDKYEFSVYADFISVVALDSNHALVAYSGNSNYGTVAIATLTWAPWEPENLRATPNTWTSTNDFTLNWKNPIHPSNITKAYYKIGAPPTSNSDYTGVVTNDNITTTAGITVSGDGVHAVRVWLEDDDGNVDFQNSSATALYYNAPETGEPSESEERRTGELPVAWIIIIIGAIVAIGIVLALVLYRKSKGEPREELAGGTEEEWGEPEE